MFYSVSYNNNIIYNLKSIYSFKNPDEKKDIIIICYLPLLDPE